MGTGQTKFLGTIGYRVPAKFLTLPTTWLDSDLRAMVQAINGLYLGRQRNSYHNPRFRENESHNFGKSIPISKFWKIDPNENPKNLGLGLESHEIGIECRPLIKPLWMKFTGPRKKFFNYHHSHIFPVPGWDSVVETRDEFSQLCSFYREHQRS